MELVVLDDQRVLLPDGHSIPARVLADRLLAPGKPADIIAIDGDPIAIDNARARALRHEGGAIYRNDTGQ